MKFTPLNLIAILFFALCISSACSNDNQNNTNDLAAQNGNRKSDAATENANVAKDDIDELEKIIRLPLMPEEVSYWEDNAPNSSGENQTASGEKLFVAIMKFSPENAAILVNNIEKIKPPVDADIETERRFPAELVAQSQLSGDETLKGKSYAANDFIQPPYKNGKITRIENTDYFVLELTTN